MCKSLRFSFASLLVISMCALMALAQSQASTGQIVGTVKNPAGELVPGATVTVTNPATGLSRTLTTNDQGGFTAVNLPSGEYAIDVEAQGFGKFTQTGYKVEVGSAITADINLSVQGVTGTVLVSAGANVETTQVQTTTNINDTSISQLPINGRRFQDFVLATPTAQIDPIRGQISLAGQRGINGNVQIDGADERGELRLPHVRGQSKQARDVIQIHNRGHPLGELRVRGDVADAAAQVGRVR